MPKGGVLENIFDIEDTIRDGDQGKSFFAFWQLLTDAERSDKFSRLLQNLYRIEAIQGMDREGKLKGTKYTLLKSGEKVYTVSAKLIEQLRRFIDDRVWIENRRVLDLCRTIEKSAVELREHTPKARHFYAIKGEKVVIDSIFAKRLYLPKAPQLFAKEQRKSEIEIDMESFYNIFYIDEETLRRNIAQILLQQPHCTLEEVTERFPVTKGVSELVSYLSIAKASEASYITESPKVTLTIQDTDGKEIRVTMPKIHFIKGGTR